MVKELIITRPRASSSHAVLTRVSPMRGGGVSINRFLGHIENNKFISHGDSEGELSQKELIALLGRDDYAAWLRFVDKLEE